MCSAEGDTARQECASFTVSQGRVLWLAHHRRGRL